MLSRLASGGRHLRVCGAQQGTGAGDVAWVQDRRVSGVCEVPVLVFRAYIMISVWGGEPVHVYRACVMDL